MKLLKQLKLEICERFQRYKGKIGTDLAISIVDQEFEGYVKELREMNLYDWMDEKGWRKGSLFRLMLEDFRKEILGDF